MNMKDRRTIFWLIITIVIIVVMTISYVSAHSWYPQPCCAESHCHPVPCDQLIEQPNGDVTYRLTDLIITVPAQAVQPSQDKLCHICIIAGSGVCAFIQYGT